MGSYGYTRLQVASNLLLSESWKVTSFLESSNSQQQVAQIFFPSAGNKLATSKA